MMKSDNFPPLERNFKLTKLQREVCVTHVIEESVNVRRERRRGTVHGKRKDENREEKEKEKIENSKCHKQSRAISKLN